MKECKNCKISIPQDAEFCCEYCGEPFEETESEKFSKALSDPSKYKVLIPIPTPEEEKEKEINLLKQEVEIAKLKKKLEEENKKDSLFIRFLKSLIALFKKKEEPESITQELVGGTIQLNWTDVDADNGTDYPFIHQYEPKIWTSGSSDYTNHTWINSGTSTSDHNHNHDGNVSYHTVV